MTGLAETVTSFLGSGLGRSDMAECTEVRVVGKHGSAVVPSYRDEKTETSQHARYTCSFCGTAKVKRQASIWHRGSCIKVVAGGLGLRCRLRCPSQVCYPKESKEQLEALSFQPSVPQETSFV